MKLEKWNLNKPGDSGYLILDGHPIRAYMWDDMNIYWNATDVSEVLGYKKAEYMLARVKSYNKIRFSELVSGGPIKIASMSEDQSAIIYTENLVDRQISSKPRTESYLEAYGSAGNSYFINDIGLYTSIMTGKTISCEDFRENAAIIIHTLKHVGSYSVSIQDHKILGMIGETDSQELVIIPKGRVNLTRLAIREGLVDFMDKYLPKDAHKDMKRGYQSFITNKINMIVSDGVEHVLIPDGVFETKWLEDNIYFNMGAKLAIYALRVYLTWRPQNGKNN